jgi:CheY-specific phosphatase CheX
VNTVKEDLFNEILERNARLISTSSVAVDKTATEGLSALQETLNRCLIESTESVFSTMCGWRLDRGAVANYDGFSPRHDVSGIISLNGAIRATVVVSFDQELMFSAAEKFLGNRPNSLNGDVVDLVGEFANMIGGNAKERLSMPSVSLGLPTVVAGAGHFIAYSSQMAVTMIPFKSSYGAMSVELGLM